MTHPHFRARLCADKEKCTNLTCLCLHPPERAKLLCSIGADCRDLSCKLNHPPERPTMCDQPDTCSNFNCTRLHGPDWNPCEAGDNCEDENCCKIHSSERNINLSKKVTAATTMNNNRKTNQNTRKKSLKSSEQRMKDWEKAQLPILSCRSEFCQRLKNERVLVVTAETGSGKSTQLPQYAAEHFGPLIVCTQPRAVAALSLARRVAEEYDGQSVSVGESVGYKIGNANPVAGTSIMFMTDAALIRDSQRDPSLKHIRVLIIDEAHERSLNTDIVIGIAKILLAQRPNDFYVVIASATIDPARFLHYFNRSTSARLEVKGRVFPVKEINKPPPSGCSDQKLIETHIIPSLVELYPQNEGHTLIFLPGQGEIDRALKIFKSKLPDDCIPLPLYGSQSPEEQEKVIKFNEKDKRMVVFCTNVAETSLTIPDVRLVIDSGWAKEARYDVKRRLTVIETVRISRSSADQRKGRAGRTAAGCCVRLYADAELKRPNIEPEILRSSLDLVLLQLVRLNLDPKKFPFMDQPNNDVISNSINLLTRLKCIDDQKITKRGELFTELGLDPRLSAFIVEIYIEYASLLEIATAIVAILSAPGTVFFMGGDKQEAIRIDLLYKHKIIKAIFFISIQFTMDGRMLVQKKLKVTARYAKNKLDGAFVELNTVMKIV
jgi:ATP-dependent helicase HrpA